MPGSTKAGYASDWEWTERESRGVREVAEAWGVAGAPLKETCFPSTTQDNSTVLFDDIGIR